VVLAACESPQPSPTNPSVRAEALTGAAAAQQQSGGVPGIPDLPRVEPSIKASGSFRPGEPITLTVHADARYGATDVQLQVTAPEIQSAKATAFGKHYRLLSNTSIPAVAEWPLGGMSKGQQQTRAFQITVPAPGYYRLYAIASASPAPKSYDDPFVMNQYFVERWLLVTAQGGVLLNSFDRSRIPQGAFQGAGPFRGLPPKRPQPQPDQASLLGSLIAKVKSMFFPLPGYYVLHAQWVSPWATGTPFGITAKNKLYHDDTRAGNLVSTDTTVIGPSGPYYSLPCNPDGSYDIWVTSLRGYNADATDEFAHGSTELEDYQCGDTFDIEMPAGNYHAFDDLKGVIPIIDNNFDASRSQIVFTVDSTQACSAANGKTSCYEPGSDEIAFTQNQMNQYSNHAWYAGHEYTHALQHESLRNWSTTCTTHYIDSVSSYPCAMKEGFADYEGTIGAQGIGASAQDWESYDSGEAGGVNAEIEGYIAATFWDLMDSNADGNDSTDYDGQYISAVFNSCRTYSDLDSAWVYMSAVDQFVWCLENRTDSTVEANNFPPRDFWTAESETASEPSGWSADSTRATWLQNLGL